MIKWFQNLFNKQPTIIFKNMTDNISITIAMNGGGAGGGGSSSSKSLPTYTSSSGKESDIWTAYGSGGGSGGSGGAPIKGGAVAYPGGLKMDIKNEK